MWKRRKSPKPTTVVVRLQDQTYRVRVGEILDIKSNVSITKPPGQEGFVVMNGYTVVPLHIIGVE